MNPQSHGLKLLHLWPVFVYTTGYLVAASIHHGIHYLLTGAVPSGIVTGL